MKKTYLYENNPLIEQKLLPSKIIKQKDNKM